jgi:hypothetical protein
MAREMYHVRPKAGGDGFIVPKGALAGFPEDDWEHHPLGRRDVDVDTDEFDASVGKLQRDPAKKARKAKENRQVDPRTLEVEVAALAQRVAELEAALLAKESRK